MSKLLYIWWWWWLPFVAVGQTETDNLLQTWNNTMLHDTQRLSAAVKLGYRVVKSSPDSAKVLTREALQMAVLSGNTNMQGKLLLLLGLCNRRSGQFDEAITCYEQSLPLFRQSNDYRNLSVVYKSLGEIYHLQSDFPKAIDCITQSLSMAETVGDSLMMADAYVALATVYYMDTENQAKMEQYLLRAQTIYENRHHNTGLGFVYNNLALIYSDRKELNKALDYIGKCIVIQEQNNDLYGLATSLHNRAILKHNLGMTADALADHEREIAIFRKFGDQEGLADAYTSMAAVWMTRKNYTAAIRLCEQALQTALDMGGNNVREADACECLYRAHKATGNYKLSLQYLERFTEVTDTLNNAETELKLRAMEIARDSLNKATVQFQKDLTFQKTLQQKNSTLGLLAVLILLGAIIAGAIWLRMLYFQRRSLLMQSRTELLEKQQLINEIALLRTQVNPHFLFNSLSILSSLVHKDAGLSEQFIEQLARSYRYILEQKDHSLVTLRTEMEFIKSYTFLLKIRFENKFDLVIQVPEQVLDRFSIAPLTLQLLVENAVKHNRMSVREPLIVQVGIKDQTLIVSNLLRPRSSETISTGIGLQNIVHRYALLTNSAVWAGERNGEFVVEIPLLDING